MSTTTAANNIESDPLESDAGNPVPPIFAEWWKATVEYFQFRRQGIDIQCAKAIRSSICSSISSVFLNCSIVSF
jgi:hypothetical protein